MANDVLKIQKLAGNRTEIIEKLITVMERQTGGGQSWLIRSLVEDLVDRMDKDGERIKNTQANKRLVNVVDTIFNQFAKEKGLDVVKSVVDGVGKIVDFNSKYFSSFAEPTKLGTIQAQVKTDLGTWLGIDKKGRLQENGYLKTLLSDSTIRNKVKDMVMTSIVGQAGYNDTKNKLKEFITGGDGDTGALNKYYRNFVYDTFSQVDRTNAKLFADKLNFRFAIYEGGLIKTSRKFCRERNGKVFHREEIAEFDPIEARPPGYNPFIDLGGYGCRHHLNWIPDALAYALRPELRTLYPPGGQSPTPEPKPEPEPVKPAPAAAKPQRPPKNTPFDNIVTPKITKFKPTDQMEHMAQSVREKQMAAKVAAKAANDLSDQYNKLQKKTSKMLEGPARDAARAEMEKILAEFSASRQLQVTAQAAANKSRDMAATLFRKKLLSGTGESNVMITNTDAINKSKTLPAKVKSAAEFFKAAVNGFMDNEMLIVAKMRGSREHYNSGTVNVGETTQVKTIIHEMAHAAEEHNAVLKSAVDFWEKRTAGQPYKKLRDLNKAYGHNEIYKEGGFSNAYIGKVYPARPGQRNYKGIAHTEIISMGLERMYHDPAGFYREDKEYFDFIYSTFFAR